MANPDHSPQQFSLYNPSDNTQSFRPNVHSTPDSQKPYLLVDNSPYSRIYHGVISNKDGRPLYDIAALAEPPGAIAIPIDGHGRVALLRQWRAVPSSKPGSSAFHSPNTTSYGFYSLELPRGFPKQNEPQHQTAIRETREELGIWADKPRLLAWTNFNTALVMTDIPIYLVLTNPQIPVNDQKDEAEVIDRVVWMTIEQVKEVVANGKIRCGLTLTALSLLFASEQRMHEYI